MGEKRLNYPASKINEYLNDARTSLQPADKTEMEQDAAETKNVTSILFNQAVKNGDVDEVTAAEHSELFEAWVTMKSYTIGYPVRYGDCSYKCLQAHTSQEGWEPDVAEALWRKIGDPTEEWPEWSQPRGATDAYGEGDKVTHNGAHWVSDCDSNVWEPGVYGWTEQTTEETEETE